MDSAVSVNNEKQLQVEGTDDSDKPELREIVPLIADTDGSCTTEWVAEFVQENLAIVKQEPDNVCSVIYVIFCLSEYLNFSSNGHHEVISAS